MNKIFLISIIGLLISGCSVMRTDYSVYNDIHKELNEKQLDERITPLKLYYDIDFLVEMIEDVHVNPYLNIERQDFYEAISSLKESIKEPITRKEFYQKITPVINLLKDSHTNVWFPNEIQGHYEQEGGLYLPFEITSDLDSRLFVRKNYSDYNLETNEEILSINDVDAGTLINTLVRYEYGSVRNSNIRRMEGRFKYHLWKVLNIESPFKIQLADTTLFLEGLSKNELKQKKQTSSKKKHASIHYELLSDEIGYLSIPSFGLSPKDFQSKMNKSFGQIKLDNPTSLIIDVRNNGGGSEENGFELLSYIAKEPYHMYSKFLRKKSKQYDKRFKQRFSWWIRPIINIKGATKMNDEMKTYFSSYVTKKYGEVDTLDNSTLIPMTPRQDSLKYNGNIYVLQNEYSYSATVGFLGAVKDYKIGRIIGTESGESPNGFGESYLFELPNSKLICRSSTTFMIRPNGNTEMTHGIIPDVKVDKIEFDTEEKYLEHIKNLVEQ